MSMIPPAPGPFPMYNPETGQWMGMGMGMYPYPAPFFPTAPMVRPDFFSNPLAYRGYRGGMPRGRYNRGRARGQNRGRGGYQSYDTEQYYNKYQEYEDTHDHRRSKYSRSR